MIKINLVKLQKFLDKFGLVLWIEHFDTKKDADEFDWSLVMPTKIGIISKAKFLGYSEPKWNYDK
jgi:hypothetical protein